MLVTLRNGFAFQCDSTKDYGFDTHFPFVTRESSHIDASNEDTAAALKGLDDFLIECNKTLNA